MGANYSDTHSSDEELREERDENQDGEEHVTTFDPALAVQHTYLGTDLEEVPGRPMLDNESYLTIPIYFHQGVLLVPGQTIPITEFHPQIISMMKNIIEKGDVFGMVSYIVQRVEDDGIVTKMSRVGTTVEIYEYSDETQEQAGFRVKAKGSQRFQLIEHFRQVNGIHMARVQILPEVILTEPLYESRLTKLDRYRIPPVELMNKRNDGRHHPWESMTRGHKLQKIATLSALPYWVYRQYDIGEVIYQLMRELENSRIINKRLVVPEDPVRLSFWVAQNLPLDDTFRQMLLEINTAVQRLRAELSILQTCKVMCCQNCDRQITTYSDIFSMSVEGPQGAYVNSGGYIHEVITVRHVTTLRNIGPSSTQHSWFPGYKWTIVNCGCDTHLGWKFERTNSKLKPKLFWGLCRSKVHVKLEKVQSEGEDTEFRPVM